MQVEGRIAHLHDDVGRQRADIGEEPVGEHGAVAAHPDDRHRLTDRSADAEDERGDDTSARRGEHDAEHCLRLGIAHGERTFIVLLRHCLQRIFCKGGDRGKDHDR